MDPQHAAAFVNLGLAYGRKGELDRAIIQFNQAIQIAPKTKSKNGRYVGGYVRCVISRLEGAE